MSGSPNSPDRADRALRRRPMLLIGLAWTAGCLLGRLGEPSLTTWMAGAGGVLLVALVCHRRPLIATGALTAGLLLTAAAYASFRALPAPDHLIRQLGTGRRLVEVRGFVCGDTTRRPDDRPGRETLIVPVQVEARYHGKIWRPCSGQVRLYWARPAQAARPGYGQRITATGLCRLDPGQPADRAAPLSCRDGQVRIQADFGGVALLRMCRTGRRYAAGLLARGIEAYPDETGVIHALLLGLRDQVDEQAWEQFAAAGLLHVFAISGLHVGVWMVMMMGLCRVTGLSMERWIWVVAPLLIIYTAATGLKPSAIRACTMALVMWSAFACGRRPDAWSALALAAVILLAAAPAQVQDPGFVLSFVIVGGLLLLAAPIYRGLVNLTRPDPWKLPPDHPPLSHRFGQAFCGLAAASLAAWIVSLPLSALYFNRVTPIGLLGNLVVIPGAFLVVATGAASMVAGLCWPVMGEVLNHANRVFTHLLLDLAAFLEQVPGGHWYVATPSPIWVGLFFGTLLGLRFAPGRRTRWIAAAGLAALLLVPALLPGPLRVDVLDVGDGQCLLVTRPRGGALLLDTGPRFTSSRVQKHLRKRGVNRLDLMILSHADTRHTGGTAEILTRWPVRELWVPPAFAETPPYRTLLELAETQGCRIRERRAGETAVLGETYLEILHPAESDLGAARRGNRSLVVRIAREGASVLVMGGAEEQATRTLLERSVDLPAEVLVVGNGGGPGVAPPAFIRATRPRIAVISTGAARRPESPAADTLHHLREAGITIWRTDQRGGVSLELRPYDRRGHQGPHILVEALASP